MTSQVNFGPKQPYKTAARDSGVDEAQSNFDGGRATKKAGYQKSHGQINVDVTVSIPVKEDPGQGQKQGTGSQGGY